MIFTEEIGEEERVIVVDPKYFRKMGAVIASAEPRVLANYIAWRAIKSTASSLTEEARDIAQDYAEKVRGTKSLPPRWKTCIGAAGFVTIVDDLIISVPTTAGGNTVVSTNAQEAEIVGIELEAAYGDTR